MKIKNIDHAKTFLFYFVLAVLIIMLMASCSSTQKNKKTEYRKSDSTSVTVSQQSGILEIDSSTYKKTEASTVEEVTLQFADESDSTEKENEYTGAETIKKSVTHQVTIAGKEIVSSRKIKSLTIKTAGKITVVDLNQVIKKDSGQTSTTSNVVVKKQEKIKEKTVKKTALSLWVYVIIAGLLIFWLFLFRKKIAQFFNLK